MPKRWQRNTVVPVRKGFSPHSTEIFNDMINRVLLFLHNYLPNTKFILKGVRLRYQGPRAGLNMHADGRTGDGYDLRVCLRIPRAGVECPNEIHLDDTEAYHPAGAKFTHTVELEAGQVRGPRAVARA